MRCSLRAPLAGLSLALAGCAPALDWRESFLPNGGASLMWPCKPRGLERKVVLDGQALALTLHSCTAGGQTWGLAFADVADPARLGPVMHALRAAAAANVGAVAPGEVRPLNVPGATPNAASGRVRLAGRRPTGEPMQMDVAVFSHGTLAFQATVLGTQVADDASDTFFSSIHFAP